MGLVEAWFNKLDILTLRFRSEGKLSIKGDSRKTDSLSYLSGWQKVKIIKSKCLTSWGFLI